MAWRTRKTDRSLKTDFVIRRRDAEPKGFYLPMRLPQAAGGYVPGSNVEIAGKLRSFLDEQETGLRPVTHQSLDRVASGRIVLFLYGNLQQGAPGRIHSGFLELGRQHLAQTLEAADLDGALTLEL